MTNKDSFEAHLVVPTPSTCSIDRAQFHLIREIAMFVRVSSVAFALLAAGCQSQQQIVESMQPDAVHVAQRRGAFEMNCPAATAEVLSNEMIQSPMMNPRFAPPQRAEYTVGVSGCGQRSTYMVVCAEGGTGCVAVGSRNTIRQ